MDQGNDRGNSEMDFGVFDGSNSATDAPLGEVRPKRSRKRTLTRVNKRSPAGKRVAELKALFTDAVGGDLTPMRRFKVETAAETVAIAELMRGAILRGEGGNMDEVVRCERRAAAAARAIGISVF
jgi:hypothetical protein